MTVSNMETALCVKHCEWERGRDCSGVDFLHCSNLNDVNSQGLCETQMNRYSLILENVECDSSPLRYKSVIINSIHWGPFN